jgi:hypothetical protein
MSPRTASLLSVCSSRYLSSLHRPFKKAFKTGKGFEYADQFLNCYHPDTPGVVQGRVKVTIELLNKEMADARPNGYRRDEPNQYPVLPKPDRPESSFNPLNPLGWMKLGSKGKPFLQRLRARELGPLTQRRFCTRFDEETDLHLHGPSYHRIIVIVLKVRSVLN